MGLMYTEVNICRAKRMKRVLPRENSQRLPRIFISLLVRARSAPPYESASCEYRYMPQKKDMVSTRITAQRRMQSAEEGTRSRSPLARERSLRYQLPISRRRISNAGCTPTRWFKPPTAIKPREWPRSCL